jgi:signal transduction histidine kinase
MEGDKIPKQGRWDLVVIDQKLRTHPDVAAAIISNKIQGLKVVLTEAEHLHSAIGFWGTGIYSYLLKPVNKKLFQLVWQNALERIQLDRKIARLQKQRQPRRDASQEHGEVLENMLRIHLKMQELEQERTKFLTQTAHELGTPLTALRGYMELLAKRETGPLNDMQQEILNCSSQSIRRLLRLSHSLMDLSILGGPSAFLRLEEANIQDCVGRALQELRATATAKKIQMTMDAGGSLPRLRFDFDRMQQVFANLVENAIKFTPEGGKIHIQCGPYCWDRRAIQETLYTLQDRRRESRGTPCNSVRIVVEDNGKGIPAEYLQDVFREYWRGASHNGSVKGFGLGLSVVRGIVEAHEGKVWAESAPNLGSRLTVLLPAGR